MKKFWFLLLISLLAGSHTVLAQNGDNDNDNGEEQETVEQDTVEQETVEERPQPTFLERLMFWRTPDSEKERSTERSKYADMNQQELDQAAWVALQNRDIDELHEILREGATVNSRNMQQRTLLIEAARIANYDAVRLLVDYGATVNAKDMYGGTAHLYASRGGHSEIVYLLLRNGARPSAN